MNKKEKKEKKEKLIKLLENRIDELTNAIKDKRESFKKRQLRSQIQLAKQIYKLITNKFYEFKEL